MIFRFQQRQFVAIQRQITGNISHPSFFTLVEIELPVDAAVLRISRCRLFIAFEVYISTLVVLIVHIHLSAARFFI